MVCNFLSLGPMSLNGKAALAEYWQHFPNCRFPHWNVFHSVHRNLEGLVSYCDQWYERQCDVLSAVHMKLMYKWTRNFWYSVITGMEDFAWWWSLALPHPKSVTSLTRRWHQSCVILCMAGRISTAYELHFVHGWSWVSPWCCHQCKKFTPLVM